MMMTSLGARGVGRTAQSGFPGRAASQRGLPRAQATNESTRMRLLWVEVVMMCIVLVMGLWQIQYLKRYFQVKKLI